MIAYGNWTVGRPGNKARCDNQSNLCLWKCADSESMTGCFVLQLQPKVVKVTRQFSILAAKMIPQPGKGKPRVENHNV